MKSHLIGWVKNLLKYGLGIGLLIYIIHQNWEPKETERGINPGISGLLQQTPDFLLFALLATLAVTCTSCQIVRWYLLVRALDLPFSLKLAFKLGLVGCFWNAFAPGSVGGDLVKGFYIAHGQPGRRASAVATVVADRLVGLFGLIWFSAAFGIAFWAAGDRLVADNDYLKDIVRVCSVLAGIAVSGWVILGLLPAAWSERQAERLTSFPGRVLSLLGWSIRQVLRGPLGDRIALRLTGLGKKIADVLAEAWYAVLTYRQQPKVIYFAIVMTAVVHTMFVLMFHLAVRVFPAESPATFPEHLVAIPIGYIAQAFFPAPGGVGGGEAIFGQLYKFLNRPVATGVMGRLTMRVNEWAIGIVGLFFFLRMRSELHVVEDEVEEMPLHSEEVIAQAESISNNG